MPTTAERFEQIKAAFDADGFDVVQVPDPDKGGAMVPCLDKWGRIAVRAQHRTATTGDTGIHKAAYYVEGTNWQMGWFMGVLAPAEVERMAIDYCDDVIFDFFAMEKLVEDHSPFMTEVKDLINDIIYRLSESMVKDVPVEYFDELKGLLAGCQAAAPGTKVTWERLWGLNYGIDCLIAHMYTGRLFEEKGVKPHKLKFPIWCNAFALTGKASAAGQPLFGRDFMFPNANVYQDVACLVVQRPDPLNGVARRCFASQTAPGIVGAMVAMNDLGMAIGIDMNPSSYCDPARPGFNGMGLNRDVAQYCADVSSAVGRVKATQRGVSWFYPMADASGASCVLETGRKPSPGEPFPMFGPVTRYYKKRLPDQKFFDDMKAKYDTPSPEEGVLVRGPDYPYPAEFIGYNKKLYRAFNCHLRDRFKLFWHAFTGCVSKLFKGGYKGKFGQFLEDLVASFFTKVHWKRCDSGERGYYCRSNADWNVPGPYYFAPQRETRPDAVVLTNHQIAPEMRLQSMTAWLTFIAFGNQPDFQWRYDALNDKLLGALEDSRDGATGVEAGIGVEKAWELIDFLDPLRGDYPSYYMPDGGDAAKCQVHGSVNLLMLGDRKIRSLWGYYGDQYVELSLGNYAR